ncbi:siderophore-interacting protein [Okibacterium endophyticum]
MSNITVTHSPSGLVHVNVIRREQVTPNMTRVTFGGADLQRFEFKGFDQWFRLAIPVHDSDRLDRLPDRFGPGGLLKYLTIPKGARPVIRNYTVRDFRPDPAELDVDFFIHGDDGVAGPWAASVASGSEAALVDQGRGWKAVRADWNLLVSDESGLPAVAGILRDMPRDATGHALIELFDPRDRQPLDPPPGMTVHWVERDAGSRPGSAVLPALGDLTFPAGDVYAFAVGESAVATGARRHLVTERGVQKGNITFSGYWRHGRAAPS